MDTERGNNGCFPKSWTAETEKQAKRIVQWMKKLDLNSPYSSELYYEVLSILRDERLRDTERLDRAEEKLKGYFEYCFITEALVGKKQDAPYWQRLGVSERESLVLAKLGEMSEGDAQERDLADDLLGILGNENLRVSMEERLEIIEDRIREFYESREKEDGSKGS